MPDRILPDYPSIHQYKKQANEVSGSSIETSGPMQEISRELPPEHVLHDRLDNSMDRCRSNHRIKSLGRRDKFQDAGRRKLLLILICLVAMFAHKGTAESLVPVVLGQSVVRLNGPWKFHLGDNPSWADPTLDDSEWETVDLTAAAGAHDEDVGLTGYVPGWGARGHRSIMGFAWYRLHVRIFSLGNQALALSGPPAVDSAYQLFCNGDLLGGDGYFGRSVPTVFSIQPRFFLIPRNLSSNRGYSDAVIAVRVWMGPWDLSDPQAGGMRIAPTMGYADSVLLRFQLQWLETIRGYIVEVIEAVLFVLLAFMAWMLGRLQARYDYSWLSIALLLTAAYRANQAVFFWGQFETVHTFEFISVTLLYPLCLGAWTLGWGQLSEVRRQDKNIFLITSLIGLYITCEFLSRSWFHGTLPHFLLSAALFTITCVRLLFAVLTMFFIYRIARLSSSRWLTVVAALLISVGQFSQELSALGLRSIWFPFGTGVSRTQFAYALADLFLFGFLLNAMLRVAAEAKRNDPPIAAF